MSQSAVSITSDEVNYLVYRYLVESEAAVHTRTATHAQVGAASSKDAAPDVLRLVAQSSVAPGALLHFLQKGLLYAEVEAHADPLLPPCKAPFSLTRPHVCAAPLQTQDQLKLLNKAKLQRKQDKDRRKQAAAASDNNAMDIDEAALNTAHDVTIYSPPPAVPPIGSVYCLAWNPRVMLLAAGSQDGKIRLWRVPADSSEGVMTECAVTLEHETVGAPEEIGVTSLDWHPQGQMLATGSVAGSVKVWMKSGELKYTLKHHTSTVFTLKWNKRGDLLGTASADASVIIWDAATGELRQQFQCHDSAVLDLDWKDDVTFATSSSDKMVYVCRMGYMEPVKAFAGHTADVNGIQWDSTSQLLASCSDDHTIKVWTMDTTKPLFNLTGHTLEVFCLRWAPPPLPAPPTSTTTTVSNQQQPQPRILATGSFDFSIRIWDMTTGKCMHVLEKHSSQVSALSFSADGAFLASGGFDNVFNVWRTRDWVLVKSFKGNGSVFEVQWGVKGDKVGVCFNDGVVAVVHLAALRDR
ncbi:hypothetical protein HDU98_011778 [Podochytrium sp. JEL0797]|nr:hypothetical protein HDU98_011778 [Podochytrium sp. JEL0797]